MQFEIKNINKENKKNKLFNLKLRKLAMKALVALKLSYPYLLTTGVVMTAFSLLGVTPFALDTKKKQLQIQTTVDNFGNKSIVGTYAYDNKKPDGVLTYYSKWYKSDNGMYEKTIKKYNLGTVDGSKVKEYIVDKLDSSPETVKSIDELFGEPIDENVESKETITEEELNQKDTFEVTTYALDKNNYIIVSRESTIENAYTTVATIGISVLLCVLISMMREEIWGYTKEIAKEDINDINDEYQDAVMKLKNNQQ